MSFIVTVPGGLCIFWVPSQNMSKPLAMIAAGSKQGIYYAPHSRWHDGVDQQNIAGHRTLPDSEIAHFHSVSNTQTKSCERGSTLAF